MREIKFRAWDEEDGCMLDSGNLSEFMLCELQEDGYAYMQYTGLKDKNGKEIYEGDVVKDDAVSDGVYSVAFRKGAWCIETDHWTHSNYMYGRTGLHVIGNIYENPELIN